MAQWLGYALWLSAWLVLVLGQAWVQSRPLCEAVHGDSSAPPSSSNFDSIGTRRPANLWRGAHTCVETRPCDRAATGVVREAMEAKGTVCRPRLVSARPCKGTECARVSVDCMDSQKCARPVCVYSL